MADFLYQAVLWVMLAGVVAFIPFAVNCTIETLSDRLSKD
jgi:hypothetical protein